MNGVNINDAQRQDPDQATDRPRPIRRKLNPLPKDVSVVLLINLRMKDPPFKMLPFNLEVFLICSQEA